MLGSMVVVFMNSLIDILSIHFLLSIPKLSSASTISLYSTVDVMDYSLLVGVDEEHKVLVLGIIDFLINYMLGKKIEFSPKASCIIPPMQYKKEGFQISLVKTKLGWI